MDNVPFAFRCRSPALPQHPNAPVYMGSREVASEVAKGVDGDDDAGRAVGQAEEFAQIRGEAGRGAAAQVGQQRYKTAVPYN